MTSMRLRSPVTYAAASIALVTGLGFAVAPIASAASTAPVAAHATVTLPTPASASRVEIPNVDVNRWFVYTGTNGGGLASANECYWGDVYPSTKYLWPVKSALNNCGVQLWLIFNGGNTIYCISPHSRNNSIPARYQNPPEIEVTYVTHNC